MTRKVALSFVLAAFLLGQLVVMSHAYDLPKAFAQIASFDSAADDQSTQNSKIDSGSSITKGGEVLIDRGREYEKYDLGNGQRKIVLGVEPWVYDDSQGKYVPHIIKQTGANQIEVQSGLVGWKINATGATITSVKEKQTDSVEDRFDEHWELKGRGTNLPLNFVSQSSSTNSTGVYVTNTYSSSYKGQALTVNVIYAILDGQPTQRIVQIDGLGTDSDAQDLDLYRVWTPKGDLNNAVIDDGSDTVTSITKTKVKDASTLKNKVEVKLNGKQLVHENLLTAGNKLKKVDYSKSAITFNYGNFATKNVQLVDDTFSSSSATLELSILTPPSTGSTCDTVDPNIFWNAQIGTPGIQLPASSSNGRCLLSTTMWNVSSIPDSSTITAVSVSADVVFVSNPKNCDIRAMENKPIATNDQRQNVGLDILNGTVYASDNNFCTTTGDNKSVDLGSNGATDLKNRLADDWFAIGWSFHNMTRTSSLARTDFDDSAGANPKLTLSVTYSASFVTVPITLNMRTGSDTPETAGTSFTITCSGGGGSHDGNPSSQNFTCDPSTTVTISAPTATATYRFVFSDGSTSKSINSCASGTCPTTTYSNITRQFKQTVTATGISASVTTITITRTQLGSTGTEDIAGSTATAIWVDQGSDLSVEDPITISSTERWDTTGTVSWNNIQAGTSRDTGTYYHQWKQTVTASGISSSVTTVTVTRTQFGSSGTEDIAGSTATGIWTDNNTDLTIEDPVTIAAGERWDTSGTVSWPNLTSAQTLTSSTYYDQYKQGVTLTGIDNIRSLHIDATQLGIPASVAVSGSTATDVWADKDTVFTIPDELIIVAQENRFKSYNGTSYLNYTVTGANTKAPVYQHEYNMNYRIHEEHLGAIFDGMPLAIYTGKINLSNGTSLDLTFNREVTDDYMQPLQRYWSANGTTSWYNITWSGIVTNATGSQAITAYGNFDLESASKHYGITTPAGNNHARLGVDRGTIDPEATMLSSDTATLNFTASASGLHNVVVEYLPTLYQGISYIKINGDEVPISNYTISADTSLSPVVHRVTIHNVNFSGESVIFIQFIAQLQAGGGSSGGGGGGGGGTTPPSLPNGGIVLPPNPSVGQAFGVTVMIMPFNVQPGTVGPQNTHNIVVQWQGATKITITQISFDDHSNWFSVGRQTPITLYAQDNATLTGTVPLTVNVPQEEGNGNGATVHMNLIAATETTSTTAVTVPVQVTFTSSANIGLLAFAAIGGAAGVGVVLNALKRR
jgi:hypothetical protein